MPSPGWMCPACRSICATRRPPCKQSSRPRRRSPPPAVPAPTKSAPPPPARRRAARTRAARRLGAPTVVPLPRHWNIDLTIPLAPQLTGVTFPCVAKPVALSASRGVIRADDRAQLERTVGRIAGMLADVPEREERETLLIEEFIAGAEVAVEGLLSGGRREILALLDKPA